MSTIKSSDEHLTINADGSGKSIKFQANGVEKASISSSGAFTSTTIDATKLTGTIPNFTSTGIDDNADATAITIDSNENVGIGVTPESWHSNYKALQIGNTGTLFKDNANGGDFSIGNNFYLNNTPAYAYTTTAEASRHSQENGVHYFQVAPSGSADAAITWTTAMTIHQAQSGAAADISMGARWSGDGGGKTDFQTNTNGGVLCRMSSSTTGSSQRMWFVNSNGLVGSVSTNGSSTVFATSSDYRLKENVNYDWDATTKLKQLKPARFNFIADDTTVIDGFIAHEVQEVVPEAVTGAKDAMRDEEYEVTPAVKDEDGNIVTEAVMGTRSVPDYQGIDQSKLVPLLVKTIQELEARITAL